MILAAFILCLIERFINNKKSCGMNCVYIETYYVSSSINYSRSLVDMAKMYLPMYFFVYIVGHHKIHLIIHKSEFIDLFVVV